MLDLGSADQPFSEGRAVGETQTSAGKHDVQTRIYYAADRRKLQVGQVGPLSDLLLPV